MSTVAAPAKVKPELGKPAEKKMRDEQPKVLPPSHFQLSEYARARYTVKVPSGWSFDEAFRPGFWVHMVQSLKSNPALGMNDDRTGAALEITTEDHRFYAELYVRAILTSGLIVQCVGPQIDPKTGLACPVDLETGGPWSGGDKLKTDRFEVRWNITKRGFDVIRIEDQQVVGDGRTLKVREQAIEWIDRLGG